MAEVSTPVPVVKMSPKKSSTSVKDKKPRSKPTHPKTSEMVTAAISNLKERKGSSLQAIKKYIVGTYIVDVDRQAPFIKRYLKIAIEQGEIIQTKGRGASGSFKLAPKVKKSMLKKTSSESKKVDADKPVAKKPKVSEKKNADKKKSAVTKKSPVKKSVKVKLADKTKKVTVKKSPMKKTAKVPTAKPKTPKPKKIASKKTVKTATK